MNENDLREKLAGLYADEPVGVLATVQPDGFPYTSLMAYAMTEDLTHFAFATKRDTQKYRNLGHEARVALLVDNREAQDADLPEAFAVTILGVAQQAKAGERAAALERLLERHPNMENFLSAPTTAIFRVRVEKHIAVAGLDEVRELHVGTLER
jgi:general stress protein 26